MDSTPSPWRARLARRADGTSGRALRGAEREFTALGYRYRAACLVGDCLIVILLSLLMSVSVLSLRLAH